MNGRCETDPLDRAVDVCDSCFGDFCESCLVRPKGRRHPVCTECVLIASGVRQPGPPRKLGVKRTAKSRRAELANATDDDKPVFEYFDADKPLDVVATELPAKKRSRKPRPVVVDEPVDAEPDDDVVEVESHQEAGGLALKIEQASVLETSKASARSSEADNDSAPSTSAVAKLDELRRQSTAQEQDTTEVSSALDAEADTAETPAEVATSNSETPNPALPVLTATDLDAAKATTAEMPDEATAEVESLDAPAPSASPETLDVPEPADATELTDPAPVADSTPQAKGKTGGSAKPRPTRRTPSSPSAGRTPPRTKPATRGATRGPAPRQASSPAKPGSKSTAAAARARRKTDKPGEDITPRTTAPMIGEVRTVGGRRGSDAPEAGPQSAEKKLPVTAAALAASEEARAIGIDEFDAGRSEPAQTRKPRPAKKSTTEPGKADTDGDGNWIPPILRGMAPNAREAKRDLPQRQRNDD